MNLPIFEGQTQAKKAPRRLSLANKFIILSSIPCYPPADADVKLNRHAWPWRAAGNLCKWQGLTGDLLLLIFVRMGIYSLQCKSITRSRRRLLHDYNYSWNRFSFILFYILAVNCPVHKWCHKSVLWHSPLNCYIDITHKSLRNVWFLKAYSIN